MNLAYASEAEGTVGRLWRKQLKLESRIGEEGEKPKWMRKQTYWRICAGIEAAAGARLAAIFL